MNEEERKRRVNIARESLDFKNKEILPKKNANSIFPIIAIGALVIAIVLAAFYFIKSSNSKEVGQKKKIARMSKNQLQKSVSTTLRSDKNGLRDTILTRIDSSLRKNEHISTDQASKKELAIVNAFYEALNSKKTNSLNSILADDVIRYDNWQHQHRPNLIKLIKNHCDKVNFEKDSIHLNTFKVENDSSGTSFEFKSTYYYQLNNKKNGKDERLNKVRLNLKKEIYYYNSMTID